MIFKIVILLNPLFIIILLLLKIKNKENEKEKNVFNYSMYLLLFSFITLVINALVGSIIDRYATICFIPATIGIVYSIYYIIKNLKLEKRQ